MSTAFALRGWLPEDAPLPWRAGNPHEPGIAGMVLDALGQPVTAVDVWLERWSDEQAGRIARALVLAINAACGFDTLSDLRVPPVGSTIQ